MACVITYNNKKYTQSEFNEYFKSHFFEFVGEFINSTSALKTSLGKELEYKDPYVPTGSLKNFKQYQVLDEKNNDIGNVVIEYRGKDTVILHPKLKIEGKGYGKDLYKLISSKFNVDIQEWGEGAIANSNAAKKMWDSLEKEGTAKRIVDEEQGDNFRFLRYKKVGSKQDIEGFKEWNKTKSVKSGVERPGFETSKESSTKISSTIYELIPNITENKIDEIYNNYVSLMGRAREGKEISKEGFKNLLKSYQVFNYKDTYIFGNYDTASGVFITRLNSSPSSRELLAEALPKLVKQGIDFASFVPKDVADKYKRSGYSISNQGFDYNFKGEKMIKYLAVSNPNVSLKIFNKNLDELLGTEIENYNNSIELKYNPVEIKGDLIEKAGKDVSKIFETYLSQFGIKVKDINEIKDKLNIDELGFADILSKIAYVKDKKDLPPIAGEFIAYMMQYNPLVSDIIKELSQTERYKDLNKEQYFKIIGGLIASDLQNKLEGNYSKSLLDKLRELIKNFFSLLKDAPVDLINKNIGIISNNILQQNKKLITTSLYKPGAFGKSTKQVSLQEAMDSDKFGASIIDRLSKKGFILTGSTSLGEQGTIQRPDENLLHDIDWVSPFNRKQTEDLFKEVYPDAIKIRDIYGEGYITDTWIITPKGHKIVNLKKESDYNIITQYDIVNTDTNKIVGTYRLQKQSDNNQKEEVVTGVEAKIIDFFSYDKYNQLAPFEKKGIKLANWKEIFKAKLQFARYKDIWDYNRFIPNENIQQNDQTFYNLGKLDQKRKKQNKELNAILSKALSNLSVEKVDENGVVKNEPITVQTLEEFKNVYERKHGVPFTQLGAAMLVDGILAATMEDGVTYAEEHLHFILEVIKDAPEVQELLTARNADGFRLLETTKTYQDNYRQYTEQYKGQPNAKNKVDMEIAAKLVAQYMYDKRSLKGVRNTLLKLLDRIIRVFNKTAKGWAKKLDDSLYPIELRKALNLIDENLEYETYISDVKQHVVKYNPSNINIVTTNPSANLETIRTQLENMKKRLDQVIKASPSTGQSWTRYKELFDRVGIATNSYDNVSELTFERIAEFKNKVVKQLKLDPGNPSIQQKLIDIQELENLFNTFDKAKQDMNQIYSIESRISKINKSISLKQYEEGLNFFLFGVGNLPGSVDTDSYDYNQYGAIFDLYKAFSKIIKFTGPPTSIGAGGFTNKNDNLLSMVRPEHIAEMKELFDIYAPIIHMVETFYIENNNSLFKGDDVRNAKVAEALRLANGYIDTIRNFLDNNDVHLHARNNIEIEEHIFAGREDLISSVTASSTAKIYTDLSMMKRAIGLYQYAKEEWLRIFQKKIISLQEKERSLTNQDANNLYNGLVSLGYKDINPFNIKKIFYQTDSNGQPTHYLNTERDIAKWNKDKVEFTNSIPRLLKEYVRNQGYNVYIPNTYAELMKIFIPIYTLKKEDKAKLPKDLIELWKVRDYYSSLWGMWHNENTEQFTQEEAKDFLADARNKLSLYHYKKLEESSIKEYTRLDGSVITYYSGALTRPKAKNPNYAKLSNKEKALVNYYNTSVINKRLQDNPDKYTFEGLNRAIQISATTLDAMTGGSKRKVFKDNLKGIFTPRIDDDIYNVDNKGNVIKLPPERYTRKLDDPALLTNDIVKAFVLYAANVNHRKVFIPELMELQGMIDMVSKGNVTPANYAYLESANSTKSGQGSALEEAMDHLMNSVVYKNTTDKTPYSTFLVHIKKYITSLNLSYNMASFVASWGSGETDKFVSAKIGELYDMEDYKIGQMKYIKDLSSIMKDFENPVKTTVLGALAVTMGVGNSTVENYSLTHLNKGLRMTISSVAPFSGWNATELLQSLPIFAISAETIRKVDGVWYNKPAYEAKFFKIPPGTTNKKKYIEEQKKKWRDGMSFMDTMHVDKGQLIFKDVPENIVNLYFLKTRSIISEMSQQYTSDAYKGTMSTGPVSNLLATHSTWLWITLDKMFGSKVEDKLTGIVRSGYYTKETLSYLISVLKRSIRELYRSLKNGAIDLPTLKYMMDPDINFENRHNIQAINRIKYHMAVITLHSALGYILAGLALGDDDDDELSVALQLASLLLMKISIEQKAKLSVNDIYEIVNNPLAHIDGAFKRFQIFDTLFSVLTKDQEQWEEYTQDGPYKGMSKGPVSLVRSTPYFKGIFENYAAWYLNPKLGGSLSGDVEDQARVFRQKSNALKRYVVEPSGVSDVRTTVGDLFALPAKLIGNTIGENALQVMDEPYYKNSSIFNNRLPSKKANDVEE